MHIHILLFGSKFHLILAMFVQMLDIYIEKSKISDIFDIFENITIFSNLLWKSDDESAVTLSGVHIVGRVSPASQPSTTTFASTPATDRTSVRSVVRDTPRAQGSGSTLAHTSITRKVRRMCPEFPNLDRVVNLSCTPVRSTFVIFWLLCIYRVTRQIVNDFDFKFKPVINSNQQ